MKKNLLLFAFLLMSVGGAFAEETGPKAMPVVEKFTGSWCGYCPAGIATFDMIEAEFHDEVIAIAYHLGDIMSIPLVNNCELRKRIDGVPTAFINRGNEFGLYPSSAKYQLNQFSKIAPASISVKAKWTDESKTGIAISTQTQFTAAESSSYAIAYVLLADGLKGSGSNWAQSNYYAGSSASDPYLNVYCEKPSTITDMVYNHVAVDAWGLDFGVDGTIETPIVAGATQKYTYTVDISSNTIIQDKTKLTAVALLIDRSTNQIVNAAKVKVDGVVGEAEPGDLNEDGEIDVTDVVELIDIVLAGTFVAEADINGDGEVDVTDVVELIDMVLGN